MMSVYDVPTKKALKACVGRVAADVLQETSFHGPELKDNGKVYVVGPGPYERKWYAQVWVTDGKISKVS